MSESDPLPARPKRLQAPAMLIDAPFKFEVMATACQGPHRATHFRTQCQETSTGSLAGEVSLHGVRPAPAHSVPSVTPTAPPVTRPRRVDHRPAGYELRSISQVPFDTTRSILTFVTNLRRILGDNAPENSRSEAQLLVVKIPPCSPYLYKRDTAK